MNLNLNNAVDDLLEWDFSITHNSRTYATRPLLLIDVARLAKLSMTTSYAELLDAAASMFVADPATIVPWLGGFRTEHLSAAIGAAMAYLASVSGKNSRAIASRVAAAMATPAAAKTSAPQSGNSMPPS